MRHSLSAWIALACTLCLFSCAREAVDVRERFSFESTIVVDCAETRTANEGNSTIWVADDAISAIHTDASDPNYYSSRFYYSGANNAFRGSVEDAALVNDWYLVYPYREENTDASKIHVTVGSTATQTGYNSMAHLAGNGYPLIGKKLNVEGRDIQMSMSQVLTLIEVKVANDRAYPITVKEVAVALPYQITGNFVGDLTPESVKVANDVTWTPEGSNATNLTMTVVDGEPIGGDGTEYENNAEEALFYIGTMPFTWKTGDQIKVKVTAVYDDGQNTELTFYKVFTANNDRVFPAGKSDWTLKNTFDDNASNYVDPDPQGPVVKENQELTFANPSLTWTLGDTYAVGGTYDFPQTVDGAKTAVTYTSLNTDIVTIVDNSKIHIEKTGTATIKASAAEDATYNPAEKTYTLTVTEAAVAPSQRTYKYDSSKSSFSSSDAGTYLIMGYESSTSGNSAVGTYVCPFPANSEGRLPHVKVSDSSSITEYTTSDPEIIAYEVELSQHTVSGTTGWVVFVKANNKYLYYDGSALAFTSNKDEAVHTISKGSSKAWSLDKTSGSSTVEFYHSGSNQDFRYRSNQNADNLKLFKLDASKKTQNISFSSSQFTYTLGDTYYVGGTYNLPQVSAVTPVTYSTTNTDVLTISGTTFTILKAGTATITATADETTSYYGATATTKIVINPASVTPVTASAYVKVTSEPQNWAGTYLFVDESSSKAFAAFSANASSYAVNVTISNGQIAATSEIAKYALTITDAGVQHANASGQEAYDVRNSDGKYIYYSSNALQIADTNSKTDSGSSWGGSSTTTTYYYYHAFKYNNNGVQVLSSRHDSGSNKYYLGYVSNAFSYSNSSADGRRIQLYKLTEGSGSNIDPEKQNQTVSFSDKNVTWTLGDNYKEGSSYPAQTPDGTYFTALKYESSNTGVVTVDGFNLKIVGTGTTTITATAQESTTYNAASDTYTLKVEAASTSGTTRTYTYQSSPSADIFLLGGYESTNSQYSIALFPNVKTGNWSSSQGEVTNGQYLAQRDINSDNTLTFTNDNEIFNAEVQLISSGSNWKIKVLSTGKYLAVPSQDNRVVYVDSESSATAFSISGSTESGYGMGGSNNNTVGISSNNYYFYHSSSAHGFSMRAYQVTNIRLYKRASEGSSTGNKQDQNLRFENATVTWTLGSGYSTGGTYDIQNLTGAMTSVEYTSSNTNVATIQNGRIRIVAAGQTTIKATAQSNSQYNAAVAEYTLIIRDGSTPSGSAVYVKATSLTVGGTYLITDVDDQRLFKGNSDGSYVSVSPSGGVITDSNGSMSAYEFTVTQSGSKYCLIFNDGQYLLCDYSNSGNSTTGLTFESSKPSDEYLYTYTVSNGAFEFKTAQRNATSTNEVLYYKPQALGGTGPDKFKIGGSGVGIGVHLYLKDGASGKQAQYLSFDNPTITLALETASGTQQGQQVKGARTSVTYSSSNENVATVSTDGRTLTIKGFGSTEIKAEAIANDNYFGASVSYTLYVNRASQAGVYNLENDCVFNYLNEATTSYTAANHSSTTLINTNYSSWGWGGNSDNAWVYKYNGVNYKPSEQDRWDCPKPVTITWSSVLSGNKEVYIYTDSAHSQQVDYIIQPITASSASNSVQVFNLIPEKAGNRITYYYVVKSGGSEVASGNFTTEGRRRMMKVSSTFAEGHANNCRDLGGQITTSDKRIKYGKIFRGSRMNDTSSDEKDYLRDNMHIGLDVDLRGDSERQNSLELRPNIENMADPSKYYSGHTNESYDSSSDLRHSDKRMGYTLQRIMYAVHNNVNVYVHCAVGADRTGFTCMMIEAILGVPLERCDMDYEMTSFSVVGTRPRTSRSISHYNDGVDVINGRLSGNSNATYQDKAIDYAVNYLGVPQSLITQFQNDMLE